MLDRARRSASYAGWLAACLAFIALSGLLLLGPSEALEQSTAIEAGEVEKVPARLDAVLDRNEGTDRYGSATNAPDEWTADLNTDDESGDPVALGSLNPPGKGQVLEKWDGATVTCYLWKAQVVAVELPDGTVLKDAHVGWYGSINRWAAGVGALGVALLMGWASLAWGKWAGLAGGSLLTAAAAGLLHLHWLPIAVAVDLIVGVAVCCFLIFRVRRPAAAAS